MLLTDNSILNNKSRCLSVNRQLPGGSPAGVSDSDTRVKNPNPTVLKKIKSGSDSDPQENQTQIRIRPLKLQDPTLKTTRSDPKNYQIRP